MSESNGFTDIALREVHTGEKTIEDLERKVKFLAERSDETSHKMLEGIQAALDILKK
ncbi:MAG TPA: hypothetical protein VHV10_10520 [Ktedonobacteraceae bacterium]|nr:hypothetical protein [Ktedonobacteraceae bacterium]